MARFCSALNVFRGSFSGCDNGLDPSPAFGFAGFEGGAVEEGGAGVVDGPLDAGVMDSVALEKLPADDVGVGFVSWLGHVVFNMGSW